MSFKTPLLCDRRVYAFKGKWQSPNNDLQENVFYFVSQPLTYVPSFVNGREELKATLSITVFGAKPFCKEDKITLQSGESYKIIQITPVYLENNILVRDMLKQRIGSIELVLE